LPEGRLVFLRLGSSVSYMVSDIAKTLYSYLESEEESQAGGVVGRSGGNYIPFLGVLREEEVIGKVEASCIPPRSCDMSAACPLKTPNKSENASSVLLPIYALCPRKPLVLL
jgi:hypothetical protein